MIGIRTLTYGWLMVLLGLLMVATPALADDKAKAQEVVDKMSESLKHLRDDPNMDGFRDTLRKAYAVMILRQFRAGFILGGSGGSGIMLSRNAQGNWSYPAFYGIGSGSIGFQIGIEGSEVALLIMTEKGRDALLTTDVKLGGDVTIAAGPVGAGAKAATTDVLSFARSKGLYGGISLEGLVIGPQHSLNHAYYDQAVSPLDILVNQKVKNAGASRLVVAVSHMASTGK